MPQQTLVSRVDRLERRVKSLEALPARMNRLESQFLQMRQEVRCEFSAVREGLRAEIRAGDEETRRLMRVLHEDVIARLSLIQENKANRSANHKAHRPSKKR